MGSACITSMYRPDGSLRAIRIDYVAMDPQSRLDICEWVKAHRVEPGLVPAIAEIGYDSSTDEWRFPVHVRGPKGGKRMDMATGEPMRRTVRRRRQEIALPVRRAGQEN